MLDLVLKLPAQMGKYEYVYRLLTPIREWIREISSERPPFPWPLPKPILWSALIRAAEDLRSAELLERLQELRGIIEKLDAVNKDPSNDVAAMRVLMELTDKLPKIDGEINRHRIANLLKAIVIFALLGTLIVLLTARIIQCA